MELGDVYLVTERLKRVPARSIDALEKALGTPLPIGYREYLTQLGIGRFSGFLTVNTPQQVKEELEYWRDPELGAAAIVDGMNVGLYGKSVLSAKKVRESFLFASTDNGDKFVSTPSCGQSLFVILDGGPNIRTLRQGFSDPLACCRAVGATDRRPWFEAANGRRQLCTFNVRGGDSVVDKTLPQSWKQQEIRRFEKVDYGSSGETITYGVRAIEGLLKVSGTLRGGHSVSISYDKNYEDQVKSFARSLGAK